jgi:hypothetical protein
MPTVARKPTMLNLLITRREARARALASGLAVLFALAMASCGSSSSDAGTRGAAGHGTAGTGTVGGTASEDDDGAAGSHIGKGGSGSGGSGGAAGGAPGVPGSGAGAGGTAESGGADSGGTSARECPDEVPGNGTPCPSALRGSACYYDDCNGLGRRSRAVCPALQPGDTSAPSWLIDTFACDEAADCGSASAQSCPVGQVCLIMEGGAPITTCVEHSCGAGPIECDCVEGCFDGCYPSSKSEGVSFTCNACSEPICA